MLIAAECELRNAMQAVAAAARVGPLPGALGTWTALVPMHQVADEYIEVERQYKRDVRGRVEAVAEEDTR